MSATANSSYCIQQQTCQPLGGHSIWAAAPPLAEPQNDGHDNMSLVMVLAPVDSTAFFKAKTVVGCTCTTCTAGYHIPVRCCHAL